MKKMIILVMAAMLALTACGQNQATGARSDPGSSAEVAQKEETAKTEAADSPKSDVTVQNSSVSAVKDKTDSGKKILIAYFSWSGNTKDMASYIVEQTGGDVFEIQPAVAYPEDYQETGDIAKGERDNNARPEILNLPEDISEYDTLFIGYPIWWHTAPMIIGTFLETYDLTGVEVYPFTQSASMDEEQFKNSMDFVRECAGGANVHDGLFVKATDTDGIQSYLSANGF